MLQMKPDRKSDTLIGHFVYQRQVEIIMQLKEGLVMEQTEADLEAGMTA